MRTFVKRYLLDTSFIIDLINEESEALKIHEKIIDEEVTGTPCVYELLKFSGRIQPLFEKEIVPFDHGDAIEASNIHRNLRECGVLIADIDILIAGIAKNHGFTLVTRDRDFQRIEGINVLHYELDFGRH